MLTIGQYDSARRDIFKALGLAPESRTAFSMYLNNERELKLSQIIALKNVFNKYGIDWNYK